MDEQRQIKRSNEAFLGGVCAGLADYFDVDHIVVRILAVLIALVTLGLGAVAYVVLWVVLPRETSRPIAFEVEPELAESLDHGVYSAQRGATQASYVSRASAPAVPPEPPASGKFMQPAGAQAYATNQAVPSMVPVRPRPDKTPLVVRIAIAVGLILLFLLVSTMVAPMFNGTQWWNLWPVAIIIAGLAMVVFPYSGERSMVWHTMGAVVALAGAMLFPMAIGFYDIATIPVGMIDFWCVLAVALMLYIVGAVRDSAPLLVGGTIVFALFCVLVLVYSGVPGPLTQLVLYMPNGHEMVFPRDAPSLGFWF